jgi:diguanylate cyclase (GGDEF)-like protein/PAS domain S-box-containing protein
MVDADSHIFRANEAYCRMVGYSQEELSSPDMTDLTHPKDRDIDAESAAELLAGEVPSYRLEKRLLTKRGNALWVNSTSSLFRDQEGNAPCVLQIVEDISDRKRAEQRLSHQALHDSLTGLPNRSLFMDRLRHALDGLRRRQGAVAVMFVDLDRFKVVNDSLGHEVGDEVLVAVAHSVEAVLRPSDTVARFGGDEMVVLCEEVGNERDAAEIADRVSTSVSEPISVQSGEIVLTASIGVTLSRNGSDSPEILLRNADAAMYRAKERGKARYEFFDKALWHQANKRLKTEIGLRQAVERNQLGLFYQPLIQLNSGEILGAEALIRWQHPEQGMLEPKDFISVAEESGLILTVGKWVFEEACRQSADWMKSAPAQGPFTVAVNVSTKEFGRPDYLKVIEAGLAETGTDPRSLCLEITESVLMDATKSTSALLQALRETGMTVAIDDFGTGYSSLQYLKDLQVDVLKVDRTFVQGLGTDSEDSAIIAAVIELAHSLGLVVVAEGVETAAQLNRLRVLGCDLAQGYHLARPQPASAVTELLSPA